ncbi:MAG: regulatory protein RecX [Balneolaceae bacterium]
MHNPKNRSTRERRQEALASLLPVTVTRIVPQKNDPDRFSLFHEESFLMGISRRSLEHHNLNEGTVLTAGLCRQIEESEEVAFAKSKAYELLARRDHASGELRTKLAQRGITADTIREVLHDLEETDLINDRTFALSFAREKLESAKWGPKKILASLRKKGISRTDAEAALKEIENPSQMADFCVDLIRKRKRTFLREDDPFKRKQKIYRYLAGKGYAPAIIQRALDTVANELHVS